ncbi:MAG: TolC family protein [Hydrogenothermaceae bacterium]|nr:TolC family protein [Hydrogenothermaceae bacterium]
MLKKFILIFTGYITISYADPLTFQEGLELLVKRNYDAVIQKYEIEKSKADIITASLRPNPTFSFNSTYINFKNFSDSSSRQDSFRIEQEIETAGKRELRKKIAQQMLNYTELNYKVSLKDMINNYIKSFSQVVSDKIQLKSSEENLKSFKKVLEIADLQHKTGFISDLDYQKLYLNLIDFEKDYYTNLENFKKDSEYLKFLVRKDFSDIEFQDLTPKLPQQSLEELLEKAVKNRYDIQASRLNTEISKTQIDYNKALAVPNVTIGLEIDGYGNKYKYSGIGFSVPIPIFDRNQGEILKSKINYIQSKLQEEKTVQQTKTEITQLYYSLISKYNIYKSYEEKFQQIKQLKENTEKAFSYRGINILTLLDTYRLYREFQKNYNQSIIDYFTTYYQLKVAIGEY